MKTLTEELKVTRRLDVSVKGFFSMFNTSKMLTIRGRILLHCQMILNLFLYHHKKLKLDPIRMTLW